MDRAFSLATFNLHNLGVDASPGHLHRLAGFILDHLGAPTILAVQELSGQDTGAPTVSAQPAATALIESICEAGGPHYRYLEVAPRVNGDGGQVGLNIRVGFFYDPHRAGVSIREPNHTDQGVTIHHGKIPRLWPNPGRLLPTDPAFAGDPARDWFPSRKALATEFQIAGMPLYVINCHLKSMRSRGRRAAIQARKQRHAQAQLIQQFVRGLLACQPDAPVVVLGDLNDGMNSRTLEILKETGMRNVLEAIPAGLRHTTSHGGVLQTLDHFLVSPALAVEEARVVHQRRAGLEPPLSDHDPVLAKLNQAVATTHAPVDSVTLVAH